MAIITLITDWNKHDFYAGALKGKLLNISEDIKIVDITHDIQPFNVSEAAFVIRNSYKYYPVNTIHLICVNCEVTEQTPLLLIVHEKQYFITTDNGIAGLIFGEAPEKIIKCNVKQDQITTFPVLDKFTDVVEKIIKKTSLEKIGKEYKDYHEQIPLRPVIDKFLITGSVIYIDSYFNVITNISKDLFERVGQNMPFEISIHSNSYKVAKINNFYNESEPGELLAIFNSSGLLEIAISCGNVAELLNLGINSPVRIKFFERSSKPELKMTGH